MTMNISSATARLQRQVPSAEAKLSDTLVEISTLMTTMVMARRDTGQSIGAGHGALMHILKVQEALLTASGEMAKAHHKLVGMAREVCGGDLEECPRENGSATPSLREAA